MNAMAFSLGTLTPPKVMVTPELAAPVITGGVPPAPPAPPAPPVSGGVPLPPAPTTSVPAAPPNVTLLLPPPLVTNPPVLGGFCADVPPKGPKSLLWSTTCCGCGCSTTPHANAPIKRPKTAVEAQKRPRLISRSDFIVHSPPIG